MITMFGSLAGHLQGLGDGGRLGDDLEGSRRSSSEASLPDDLVVIDDEESERPRDAPVSRRGIGHGGVPSQSGWFRHPGDAGPGR